ncbi:MAG: stalk domain-containing protein [Clostridia bacterium]
MKEGQIAKFLLALIMAATVITNTIVIANADNMYENSDFIEKEQPELSEETKKLISLYQKDPTEENYINLRAIVIENYNAVLDRKEEKLAELKDETSGKPGGAEIVAEMEEIVQDMYITYWNRINSSMLRFTDTRLLKWRISDAAQYDYIPVMGAGESIYIKRTQVTNSEYSKFIRETGRTAPENWEDGTYPKSQESYPVNYVSIDDGKAYCDWLTEKDGVSTYRLPNESEWELVAGHMPKDADFNCGINDGRTPVDEYALVTRGAHGAIDFWGNVWEWTSTVRDENDDTPIYGIKGGSWKSDRTDCRTEYRKEGRDGNACYDDVGFRVIKVLNGYEPEQKVQLATLDSPVVYISSQTDDSITLSWESVEGANEYQIFEYFEDTDKVEMLNTTKETTATLSGLKKGSTHSYIVQPISYVEIADNVTPENSVSATCGQGNYAISVFVNGIKVDFSKYDNVFPVIENGRTLVPIRAVSETLKAEVEWYNDTEEITVTKGDIFVKMAIGNSKAYVNGIEQQLDTLPTIRNGRTLVPLRFVAESLKLNVEWIDDSSTVIIE